MLATGGGLNVMREFSKGLLVESGLDLDIDLRGEMQTFRG